MLLVGVHTSEEITTPKSEPSRARGDTFRAWQVLCVYEREREREGGREKGLPCADANASAPLYAAGPLHAVRTPGRRRRPHVRAIYTAFFCYY